MKTFSVQLLHKPGARRLLATCLTAVVAGGTSLSAPSIAFAADYPISPEQRSVAEKVAQSGVPLEELAPNAPDSYSVVNGDTLWDISAKFLKRPWRWPELWGMNRDQVNNPHLIYPGQVLKLVKSGGKAQLQITDGTSANGADNATVKLNPHVRSSASLGAIPSIPSNVIEPFLSKPLIVEENQLATAPRIVATQEGHLFTGAGDVVYVRGLPGVAAPNGYSVFRPARPLVDPDTQKIIAYEARYLGSVEQTRAGDPATFRVISAKEEIGVGDRLVAAEPSTDVNFSPKEANHDIDGRVLSIYGGGVDQAASNMVIALNRGKNQGVERGHVLRLFRYGETFVDKTVTKPEKIRLPDEAYGYVFIFRVFDNVSYGLIVNSRNSVRIGDRFSSKLD
jgi:LysM repeat protein